MRWHADLRLTVAGALAALVFAAATHAADFSPQPFKATYGAALNGMPLGIEVTLGLANAGGNDWDLALTAGSLMMHYQETSRFHWHDCSAEPHKYRFEFRGFGVDRKLALDFDHATHLASGESRRGPVSFTFTPDAVDELALTYAARCQLLQGAEKVTFDVATTTGMKQYSYRVDGREIVKTPYGKFDTVRIVRVRKDGDKRRDTLWVAPSLGYIMVKMEHVEKLGVRGMVTLKALEGIRPAAP